MNKEKTFSLKNKKIIAIIILLIIFIACIPIGYALFSDVKNEEKSVQIGKIEVVIEEDPEWEENEDEYGIKKYTKSIKGVSTAEQDAYVRIRCIPIVEFFVEGSTEGEGEWLTAPVSQEDIQVVVNTEDWVQQGDYWYYTKILKGFEKTEPINIDWKVLSAPSELEQYPIRTDVRIILEYSQVSNNMWKEIFQIEDLPQEVERVTE